jgi:hypothetical protein
VGTGESKDTDNEVLQQAENETRFLDRRTGFAGYTGGLGEWLGYDGLEGQRPRLTHFSATAARKSLSDTTLGELTTERLKKVWTKLTEFSELQA